ncbi:Cupredoxin, partial [Thozetella sp. PMI_491]
MILSLTLFALVGVAMAKSIKVEVGENGFTFNPSTIQASVGDTLEFVFYPQNHSVALGDFGRPCQPASSSDQAFCSGFLPVQSGEAAQKFVVTIKTTSPLFFYCPAPGHCRSGMVGAVNPNSDQTLDDYRTAAHDVHSEGVPVGVFGGDLEPNDESDSGSSSSSSTGTVAGSTTTSGTTATSGTASSAGTSPPGTTTSGGGAAG